MLDFFYLVTVVKTLSSSAGSLPPQKSCGRVVAGMYVIITFSTKVEQKGVIRELCTLVLDVLIEKVKPLVRGTILCLDIMFVSSCRLQELEICFGRYY